MRRHCRSFSTDHTFLAVHAGKWGLRPQVEELEHRCVLASILPQESGASGDTTLDSSSDWIPRAPLNYHDVLLSSELGETVSSQFGELKYLQTFSPNAYPHHDLVQWTNGQLAEFWSNSGSEGNGIWRSYDLNGTRITEKIGLPVVSAGRLAVGNVPIAATALDSGGYAIIWSDALGIRGMFFPNLEASTGTSFFVASATDVPVYAIDIVNLDDQFLVAWSDPISGSINSQGFDASGRPTGDVQTIYQGVSLGGAFELQWTRSSHDSAVLVWSKYANVSGESQFQHLAQRWHVSTGAIGGIVELGSSQTHMPPALAVDLAGRWGVVSTSTNDVGSTKIILNILNESGDQLSATLLWEGHEFASFTPSRIAPLTGGGFAVVCNTGSYADTKLRLMIVNSAGQVTEEASLAVEIESDLMSQLTLSVASDRTVTAQWLSSNVDDGIVSLVQQSVRTEYTPLHFRLNGPPPALTIPDSDPFIRIFADGGVRLASGESQSPGEWWLDVDEMDWIAIDSSYMGDPISFELSAYDPFAPDDPFHTLTYRLGTADDDLLVAEDFGAYISGGDGIDTASIDGFSLDYEFVEDSGILIGRDYYSGDTTNFFENVEFFEFYDGVYSVEEVLMFAEYDWDWLQGLLFDDLSYDYDYDYDFDFEFDYEYEYDDESGEYADQEYEYTESMEQFTDDGSDYYGEGVTDGQQVAEVPVGPAAATNAPTNGLGMALSDVGQADREAAKAVRIDIVDLIFGTEEPKQFQQAHQTPLMQDPSASPHSPVAHIPSVAPRIIDESHNDIVAELQVDYEPSEAPKLATTSETPEIDPQEMDSRPSFDEQSLWQQVEELAGERHAAIANSQAVAGAAVVVAVGFSTTQIAWLLRGSAMLSKLCSSMPVWISFDPLPLLEGAGPPPDARDSTPQESLADIIMSQRVHKSESPDASL